MPGVLHLGYLAGALTVASFLPQLVRTWRTRQTKDLSVGMFGLLVVSASCWTAYGVLTHDRPVIATNLSVVLLNAALVIAKLRYR
jgi:MtN3 and saliva related transmembrane protein